MIEGRTESLEGEFFLEVLKDTLRGREVNSKSHQDESVIQPY
jgi:hypothetical protein